MWKPLKEKSNKLINGEDLTVDELKKGTEEIENLRNWVTNNMPEVEWRIDGIVHCCSEVSRGNFNG
jgi:hypothetical protein